MCDRAQCLCRIFTSLAESFLYHVIHQPHTTLGDIAIMDMLVQCVKHPDYEVCINKGGFVYLDYLVCKHCIKFYGVCMPCNNGHVTNCTIAKSFLVVWFPCLS